MTNNNNTYNQPQMGQMMPPQIPPRPRGRQARWAQWLAEQQVVWKSLPKWLSAYSIIAYVLALTMVTIMYTNYSMAWYYMLAGILFVTIFFLYGSKVIRGTLVQRDRKESTFEKHIFVIAFVPRLLYMLLIYWIFQENYGDAFGFENADPTYYDELGVYVATLIEKGDYHFYDAISKFSGHDDIADMGYGIYVGFIYWLTGTGTAENIHLLGGSATASTLSILSVRLMKCVWSSLTVLLIYRLAKRNFETRVARIAAVFVALWPNFWYYCTSHLKEVEMVFLAVLFVEQADQMMRSRKFTAWKVIPVLIIAAAIFTFRTPLGLVALLALVFSIVMSSTKVVTWGKRIIVGALAIALIGIVAGNRIQERTESLMEQVQTDSQDKNMEWRSQRENGNELAKYAGAAVFAPMIFTLPFPTMARPYEGQEMQQLNHGGNYIKNIMSFFTIFAMIMLLMSGRWREHLLPLSFMLGYLLVLTMSEFAQSERFHQPIMPFEFMFAAYGLNIAVTKKKYKRWFTYWCALMVVAALAWNWFKLSGRGLV